MESKKNQSPEEKINQANEPEEEKTTPEQEQPEEELDFLSSDSSPIKEDLDFLFEEEQQDKVTSKLPEMEDVSFSDPASASEPPPSSGILEGSLDLGLEEEETQEESSPPGKAEPKKDKAEEPKETREEGFVQELKDKKHQSEPKKGMSTLFGKVAILLNMATQDQVNDALLSAVTDRKGKKIGEIMVEMGYLTAEQADIVASRQKTKTMICPKCEKKYQVVLYQKERTYKCQVCKGKLVPLSQYARKKKLNEQSMQEKLQVMGLTQTLPKFDRKKRYDTSGLHFIDDQSSSPAPSQKKEQTTPPSSEKSNPTTSMLLEQAGVEVPDEMSSDMLKSSSDHLRASSFTDSRPILRKPPKKSNGKVFTTIAIVGVVLGFYLFVFSAEDPQPKQNESNSQQTKTLSEAEIREQKMEERYRELKNSFIDQSNEKAVRQKLKDYRSYLIQYSESPYQQEIKNEIERLETIVAEIRQEEEFAELKKDIEGKLQRDLFAPALKDLQEFLTKVESPYLRSRVEKLITRVEKQSMEHLLPFLEKSQKLVSKKQFNEALNKLKQAKHKQTSQALAEIAQEEKKVQQAQSRYQRAVALRKLTSELFPLLQERDYSAALEHLQQKQEELSDLKEDLNKYQKVVQDMEKIWQVLVKNIQGHKGKVQKFLIEGERKPLIAKLTSFGEQSGSLILLTSKGRARNIKLEELHRANIYRFLQPEIAQNSKEFVIVPVFLASWKTNINLDLYQQQQHKWLREISTLLLVEQLKKAIAEKHVRNLVLALRTLSEDLSQLEVYQIQRQQIAQLLLDKAKESQSQRFRQGLLGLAKKYFPEIYQNLADK